MKSVAAFSLFMLLSSITGSLLVNAAAAPTQPAIPAQPALPDSAQPCISLSVMLSELHQKYNESIQRILKDDTGSSLVITAAPSWHTWTEMAVTADGCTAILDYGENAGSV